MFMLRKRIPAFLLAGILLCFLCSCSGEPGPSGPSSGSSAAVPSESVPEQTEKPWEPSEYVLSWNLDGVSKLDPESGMTVRKAEGGVTVFQYLSKDGVRTLFVKDRKKVPKLDQNPLILLKVGEDGEILDSKDLTEEGYRYTCCSWYAESIDRESHVLSLRSDAIGEAMQYLLDLTAFTASMTISKRASSSG